MGNGAAFFGSIDVVCSSPLFTVLRVLNVSDQVQAGTVPAQGRGTAQYALREGGALIGCVEPGAVDLII